AKKAVPAAKRRSTKSVPVKSGTTKRASTAAAKPTTASAAKRPTTKSVALKSGTTKGVALKSGTTKGAGTVSAKPTEVSVGTDAAFAPGSGQSRRRLKNISEVRHFFRTNDVPILFFGATPFNLLGLDRWVRNFTYITYYDAWDGA